VIDIPAAYNPRVAYGCAVITPQAERLAQFLATYAGVKGQQLTEPLPGEPEEF
jgi:hypothetical protein